jgi:hypothetical protein
VGCDWWFMCVLKREREREKKKKKKKKEKNKKDVSLVSW